MARCLVSRLLVSAGRCCRSNCSVRSRVCASRICIAGTLSSTVQIAELLAAARSIEVERPITQSRCGVLCRARLISCGLLLRCGAGWAGLLVGLLLVSLTLVSCSPGTTPAAMNLAGKSCAASCCSNWPPLDAALALASICGVAFLNLCFWLLYWLTGADSASCSARVGAGAGLCCLRCLRCVVARPAGWTAAVPGAAAASRSPTAVTSCST